MQAGAIAPCVRLLQQSPDAVAAELAAAVLRNLAVQNPANRQAIRAAGGVQPLLHTLGGRQDRLTDPMPCEVGSVTSNPVLQHLHAAHAAHAQWPAGEAATAHAL